MAHKVQVKTIKTGIGFTRVEYTLAKRYMHGVVERNKSNACIDPDPRDYSRVHNKAERIKSWSAV
jgi:hypothetical protein